MAGLMGLTGLTGWMIAIGVFVPATPPHVADEAPYVAVQDRAGTQPSTRAEEGTWKNRLDPKISWWLHARELRHRLTRVPPREDVAVLVRFRDKPTEKVLRRLEENGVSFRPKTESGGRLSRDVFFPARVAARGLKALDNEPTIVRVDLDELRLPATPLDLTAHEIEATSVWREESGRDPLDGRGVTVGLRDTGVDVYYPAFFAADLGAFAWIDVNGDARFDPGTDAVDLDGDDSADRDETLRFFDSVISNYGRDGVLGSGNGRFDAGYDYLFADANRNGQRDYGGSLAGFGDASPAFGEPMFVADDVNGNGRLDREEKVFRLGSSKIRAVRSGSDVWARGRDLSNAAAESYSHGTGTTGIVIAGQPGFTRRLGVAPAAEVLMSAVTGSESLSEGLLWLAESGADVVLHEFAPWTGYHLDGSSNFEQLMDDLAAQGIAHANPAGNLGGSAKHMRSIMSGNTLVIPIEVPEGGFEFMEASFLWREPVELVFTLVAPGGQSVELGPENASGTPLPDGLGTVFSFRDDSARGTKLLGIGLYEQSVSLAVGEWSVRITKAQGTPNVQVLGYVQDELSGWGRGIAFLDDVSEDGLIGFPATADSAITVSAYAGHTGPVFDLGYFEEQAGELRRYSGRGVRIDGVEIMDIAAPDNPIVPFGKAFAPGFGWQQVFGGTSGAGPHVAGAAALLKQLQPTLTGEGVKDAIQRGAIEDALTGPVPSRTWGYGRLRAYRSLFGSDPVPNTPPTMTLTVHGAAHVGTSIEIDAIVRDAEDAPGDLEVRWDDDYDGVYETVFGHAMSRRFELRNAGFMTTKVEVRDTGHQTTAATVRIEVTDPLPPLDGGVPGGDGGLGTDGGPGEDGGVGGDAAVSEDSGSGSSDGSLTSDDTGVVASWDAGTSSGGGADATSSVDSGSTVGAGNGAEGEGAMGSQGVGSPDGERSDDRGGCGCRSVPATVTATSRVSSPSAEGLWTLTLSLAWMLFRSRRRRTH